MSTLLHDAFHFESLVWHGSIAVYLFLLGLAAGATLIALYLKHRIIEGPAWQNGFIRAVAVISPIGIMVSMGILITHLTKPLTFWKLMFNYNLDSVMSIGVIMFQVYTAILFVWLAIIFYEPLEDFILNFWGGKLRGLHGLFQWAMNLIRRFEISIELVLGIIAVALGVYTGFLLSALKTYPMLDNPWLPVLFLFSGISSGVAGTLLLGVTLFKEEPSGPAVHWMHTIEKPLIFGELLILGVFFGWLILDGGRSEVAALAAIAGGFWAMVFWVGVVGLGLLTPLALQTITPHGIQHSTGFVVVLTSCSLLGVVALRYFVLYAGQMTVF